jgi:hypothetical protein
LTLSATAPNQQNASWILEYPVGHAYLLWLWRSTLGDNLPRVRYCCLGPATAIASERWQWVKSMTGAQKDKTL